MIKGVICELKNSLGELLHNLKKHSRLAISFVAAFVLGIVFCLCFETTALGGFFRMLSSLCFDAYFCGAFFDTLWRLVLAALILTTLFILFSQHKLLLILGYFVLFIKGFAFVLAAKAVLASASILAFVLILPLLLAEQLVLIVHLCTIVVYYYCNNISIRQYNCRHMAYFYVLACILSVLQCIVLCLIAGSLLWLV